MSLVDRWPSTPMKLITGWAMTVALFVFLLVALANGWNLNEAVLFTTVGFVAWCNGDSTLQFFSKRKTSWEPPNKSASGGESESGSPPPSPEPTGESVTITSPSMPALKDAERLEKRQTTTPTSVVRDEAEGIEPTP